MNKLIKEGREKLIKNNQDPNLADYLYKYLPNKKKYSSKLKQVVRGKPIQYVIGSVNFYGLELIVKRGVLIPRFETEELVALLIDEIKNKDNLSLLDIGTGSGCIAIALKAKLPKIMIDAIDISLKALRLAKKNALINKTEINIFRSNLFNKVTRKYDVIISNPPYLDTNDDVMPIVKKYEPKKALYARNKGIYFYEAIINQAKDHLNKEFIIAFEIGCNQKEAIIKLAKKAYPNAIIKGYQDMAKKDRFIIIKSKNFN